MLDDEKQPSMVIVDSPYCLNLVCNSNGSGGEVVVMQSSHCTVIIEYIPMLKCREKSPHWTS